MFCKTFLWKLTTAVRDVSALMGLINFSSDTKNKNNLSLNCWNLSNFTLCEVFRLRSWTRVFNFLQNCKRKSLGSERKRKSMQWQSAVEETSWKRPQTKTLFFFYYITVSQNCSLYTKVTDSESKQKYYKLNYSAELYTDLG